MKKNFLKKSMAIAISIAMVLPNFAMAAESASAGITSANAAGEYNDSSEWSLVWSDEFDGNKLDTSKWAYETGSGHNNEKQYYTKDNLTVSDGTLKITAKKESVGGYNYTSGRIETITGDGQKLFATKYGKIEARIKLPAGTGLWPAFWMMPADSEYGTWPLSGEIDIMEARGRVLNEVNGTIHFGETRPFNRSIGGTYQLPSNTDITDYHVYGIEWKENVIIWYVDGVEFFRTSNWYTMNDGNVAEYPAPFNKEFYLILNLAVGGDYDGGKLPSSSDLPGTMEVDYVRVYHNNAGYSSSNIYMPEGARDDAAMAATPVYEDGNLLSDINFTKLNKSVVTKYDVDLLTHNWYLMTNKYYPGSATATTEVINGVTFANIDITDPGTTNYSVQLKQLLPLAKGYLYNVSFDAKCNDGERAIKVKPIGETNYCSSYTANLTNKVQNFQFSFIMEDASDKDATLEFNLGQYAGDVSIGNVKVTVVDTYKEAERKPEATDSDNRVEGIEKETEKQTEETETTSKNTVVEKETTESKETEKETVVSKEEETTSKIEEATTSKIEETTNGSNEKETTKDDIVNAGSNEEETTAETYPEKETEKVITGAVLNGDFSQGTQQWKGYDTSYSVEDSNGNSYAKVYGMKSKNPWDRQWLQKGIFLTEGKTYKLQFKAKCSVINQKFAVVLEDAYYDKDLYKEFKVGKVWKTYSFEFTASTDSELALRYYLGMVSKSCKLYLDDVSITIVE